MPRPDSPSPPRSTLSFSVPPISRILVVDDDLLREVIAGALTLAGHFVVQAADGHQALDLFRATTSDLVLTAIILPGQEGIETIRQLRQRHPALRIIAMSGGSPHSKFYPDSRRTPRRPPRPRQAVLARRPPAHHRHRPCRTARSVARPVKILHLEDHALDATFVRDLLPAALALPRGNGELILVVDDESDIRDVTTTTLSRHGYRVVAAHDGSDAFALFAPRSRELSVMITDLNMPRLDGAPSPALSAVSTPP